MLIFLCGVFTPGLCQLFSMLPAAYLFLIIGCCWIIAHKGYETTELSGWPAGWLCYQLFWCQADTHPDTEERVLFACLPNPSISPGDWGMSHVPSVYPYFPRFTLWGYIFPACFPCCFWRTLTWDQIGRTEIFYHRCHWSRLEDLRNQQIGGSKTFLSITGLECLSRGYLFCPQPYLHLPRNSQSPFKYLYQQGLHTSSGSLSQCFSGFTVP